MGPPVAPSHSFVVESQPYLNELAVPSSTDILNMKETLKKIARTFFPENCYSRLADWYVLAKYSILKFHCPFCNKTFRKLLPAGYYLPVFKEKKIVGGGYRLDALCPGCGSSDRERLVYLYLRDRTDFFRQCLKVLHVAPEKNLEKALRADPGMFYVSSDLNSPSAMVRLDITNMPYHDCSFDVIICNHVLEHIPDDHKAMSELFMVLKPGGWAILQVPISLSLDKTYEDPSITLPEARENAFGQSDHVRIYARDYADRLRDVGFGVKVYSLRKEVGWVFAHQHGLLRNEDLFICSKVE